uniref:Uncharacterized protein LOC105033611 n=1 Tax=Elaeis guineensis var. tenera TaxID=51953 RepID=A0A6I9QCJ4_ELAGV|nr:uncharacterized protein LOC105033611 [Elaeis guineensis]XP_029117049.1 uncharacterized protein LOC105033611 [Elaeis guineensis]
MMASACVNNAGMSPEPFLDCSLACPSYGWPSPRISFSRDLADDTPPRVAAEKLEAETLDLDAAGKDLADFEFRLDDPVAMLPADELFSNGKLVPLRLATAPPPVAAADGIRSPEATAAPHSSADVLGSDAFVAESPKAPRCSSRWRELLGLKRQQSPKPEPQKAISASTPSKNPSTKSLRHFLHRSTNPKSSSTDSSLSLPLLRDSSDTESVSISSRLSLSSSSSSSGLDHEDLPRLSLDVDKPSQIPLSLGRNPPRVRVSRPRSAIPEGRQRARFGRSPVRRPPEPAERGASVDSPRMNASGKVVFQGLERSSSSPSSFSGGPRIKYRGMERSYSANVRVTPVLNVPVCSLRGSSKFGFGHLFSPQKKEKEGLRQGSRTKIEI